ncbi:uncharacterized protein [Clytia hemisphaerica]|uniref:Uncharacterized protein n=1 Tax=Clytia hemisphaerica TaxID=252671 RepID=A0A7M6DMX5_9CNID
MTRYLVRKQIIGLALVVFVYVGLLQGQVVDIKTKSFGCYLVGDSSTITVNGTGYLFMQDGISVLTIQHTSPDTPPLIEITTIGPASFHDDSVLSQLNSTLTSRLTKEGTVLVIALQSTCFDEYAGWLKLVQSVPNLDIGKNDWDDDISAGVIIGCYKKCPVKVSGETIPVTELGDDDTEVDIDVVLDLNHLVEPALPSHKKKSSPKLILYIIPVIFIFLFIVVFLLYFCCYKKRRRRRLTKRREAEDYGGESTNQQQELNQCLLDELQEEQVTMEDKLVPKLQKLLHKDGDGKQNEYTRHPNTKREDENNLYEPVTEDQSSKPLLNAPQQKPEAEVIYKTPSGASNRSGFIRLPTQNQPSKRYQDLHTREIHDSPGDSNNTTDDNYENYEPPKDSPIYKVPQTAIYKSPSVTTSNEDNTPIYKSPPITTSNEDNTPIYKSPSTGHYQAPTKHSEPNNNAPKTLPSNMKLQASPPTTNIQKQSPGTSRKMFQQCGDTEPQNEDGFASYIQLNDEENTIYKTPSNAKKHEPPSGNPGAPARDDGDDETDDHDYEPPVDRSNQIYQNVNIK